VLKFHSVKIYGEQSSAHLNMSDGDE